MISKLINFIVGLFPSTEEVNLMPCGCHQDKPDDRDYIKEILSGTVPEYVNLLDGINFAATQQYRTNACTGHAMAAFLTILYSKLNKEKPILFNYYYIYYWGRMLAFGNIKNDAGSYLRHTMQAVQKHGALSKDMCTLNSVYKEPKKEECENGHLLNIKNYFRLPNNIIADAMVYTLVKERLPILTALYYRPSEWNRANYKGVLDATSPNEKHRGGHAICIYGYDPKDDTFLATNSWGPTWGKNGFFKITRKGLESNIMDAWTVEYNYF